MKLTDIDKLLTTARKHRVSTLKFQDGLISEVIFYRPSKKTNAHVKIKNSFPQSIDELKNMTIPDMPTDEELRYQSTDFVPSHMAIEDADLNQL